MDRSADNLGQIINDIQRDLEELKTTQIRTEDIPDDAITTEKLADGAVTNAKINWGGIRKTLYTGGTPSTTSYPLSEAITNFDYILVVFTSGTNDNTQRPTMLYDTSRLTDGFYFDYSALYSGTVYSQHGRFSINSTGTQITRNESSQSANYSSSMTTGNYISIYKVEGIKLS